MFNPFKKTYAEEEKRMFRFLQRNYLFRDLKEEEIAEFLPYMYLRRYEKGEAIFFRNDPSQAFYIVHKGIVVLNIDVEDKFEELTHLRPTEIFGENALLKNTFRLYNAVGFSESCELYVIPATNVGEIFDSNPKIKTKMMTAMAEYYNRYTSHLFQAYQESFGFFELGRAFSRK